MSLSMRRARGRWREEDTVSGKEFDAEDADVVERGSSLGGH